MTKFPVYAVYYPQVSDVVVEYNIFVFPKRKNSLETSTVMQFK